MMLGGFEPDVLQGLLASQSLVEEKVAEALGLLAGTDAPAPKRAPAAAEPGDSDADSYDEPESEPEAEAESESVPDTQEVIMMRRKVALENQSFRFVIESEDVAEATLEGPNPVNSPAFKEAVAQFKEIHPGWTAPMNRYPPGSGQTYTVVWADDVGLLRRDAGIKLLDFATVRDMIGKRGTTRPSAVNFGIAPDVELASVHPPHPRRDLPTAHLLDSGHLTSPPPPPSSCADQRGEDR
jgi:hypothetical protein